MRWSWGWSSRGSWQPPITLGPLLWRERDERRPALRGQALARAEAQEAARREALLELAHDAGAQIVPEVDEHVAAEDDRHLGEDVVGDQTVLEEEDAIAQRLR